ncbi:cyclic dof factor 4 [Zea mays]|jgi:hypothetical protein|uniref:Dof zinc finger protein DOF1.5 n=2 Tax=Zea mays TaxID=4577 RepID=A0A1D6FTB4_MAIZE|nr:cyclic dof factor 4 [Zea mays]AQK94776.1 Dof zinc finger protein DOF1.5 [Zea mays]|eukprot:XP_008656439.1 cyclic dof factor 4 [Zea mays]
MLPHVEMPVPGRAAAACTGAAGIKLFGKVITTPPHHAGAAPPRLQQAAAASGRGSADLLEEVARARAAAAEVRLPCPRCLSRDTKFCYFNNYNVNQPRHFCRACHRYWTAGGAIRNVPIGSGRRKNRPVLLPPPAPHAVTATDNSRRSGAGSPPVFGSVFTAPYQQLGAPTQFTTSPAYAATAPLGTTGQCLWLVATADHRSVASGRAFDLI